MKKQQLIIALSASMLLMSCGVNDNSSPKNVKASDFTTCFNANTSGSITKNNNVTSTGNFFSDLNTDHFSSIISYDGVEKSFFYEKNSEGGVDICYLDENNKKNKQTELALGKFDECFVNPFIALNNKYPNETTVNLTENNKFTDIGLGFTKFFDLGSTILSSSTSITVKSGLLDLASEKNATVTSSITFGETATLNSTVIVDDTSYVFNVDFVNPNEYKEIKVSPLSATEESNKLKVALNSLKEGNYTVTVKKDNTLTDTLYVNKDRFLHKTSAASKGYLKTDTGYKVVAVSESDNVVTEESNSTDLFSSLIPDYEVSSELFVDGKLTTFVSSYYDSKIKFPFKFAVLDAYLNPNDSNIYRIKNISLNEDASILTLTLIDISTPSITVSIEWSNIGSTTLPVDISNITTVKNWDNTIDSYIKGICGDDFVLPYFDSGYEWKKDKGAGNGYASIYCEAASLEEADELITAYDKVMTNAGHNELTADERSELDDIYFYFMGDINDFEHYHMYAFSGKIIEVYSQDADCLVEDGQIFIYISDDER